MPENTESTMGRNEIYPCEIYLRRARRMDRTSVAERTAILLAAVTAGVLLVTPSVFAVPSFARQTGLSCEACHTVFPELTHFGRMFKANGYTLTSLPQVQGMTEEKEQRLSLNQLPPLSMMVQVSDTQLAKALPDSSGLPGRA